MTDGQSARSAVSETSLHDLYENAPVGQVSVDSRDCVVKINQTLLRLIGATGSDLVGVPFRDLLTPGSAMFYDTRFQPVLRLGGEVNEVSLTMRVTGGEPLPVLVNARSVAGEGGEVTLVRLAIFDSTSRQGYEREMLLARRAAESSEARVRVLQDASIAFAASKTEEGLAVTLMESARLAVSAGSAAVLLCDENKNLRPVAGSHPLAMALADLPGSPVARAIAELEPASLENARNAGASLADVAAAVLAARFEAVTVVPLVGESETIGVLVTLFGRARTIVPELIGLEQALARQAVEALTRIRLQAELTRLALHDGLTGLANRTLLMHRLGEFLAAAQASGQPLALVFLDLDGFKLVNDELGHYAGDEVLRQVATRLVAIVRPQDVVARLGGDEFVVVCCGVDLAAARSVADRLVTAVAEPMPELPDRFRITASAGLAFCAPGDREVPATVQSVLAAADGAMYRSKQARRGSITEVMP